MAVGEGVDDAVPEAAVDEVSVDEDDRLPLAVLPVADRPAGSPTSLAAADLVGISVLLARRFGAGSGVK